MKRIILFCIAIFVCKIGLTQSISPSIISINKTAEKEIHLDSTEQVTTTSTPKFEWFFPFRNYKTALVDIYDEEGSKFGGLNGVSIRPSIDSSNSTSIYVELVSIIPWNAFRIGFGSNLVQVDLTDSTRTPQDIAFQKLTNGGGNIVLNLNRPILYFDDVKIPNGFFVSNLDITGYADLPELNKDIYNPGWGSMITLSYDLRLINIKYNERQEGNLLRFGLNGKYQYNIFNESYKSLNELPDLTNKLSMGTFGAYLGLAMFNIQISYNVYNKSDIYLDDKDWLLRVEVVPVKF